ncbi:uncharacterized protein LOC106178319 isoform X1 [Lingula anatina]|uniref:Uncharacterized protein LOC106178319 isoform X1 n=1 Tax=Lingula anatina TaxID=7574 RepID=A0A1S3K2M7_LINAN|nr:uncharacterized protein LOC106178319 isoform X1 [Lingula anatina]|eukprot:XP_013416895.1 uncharacterized protein LOC106178319 isoform X1 [Lingula anatina]
MKPAVGILVLLCAVVGVANCSADDTREKRSSFTKILDVLKRILYDDDSDDDGNDQTEDSFDDEGDNDVKEEDKENWEKYLEKLGKCENCTSTSHRWIVTCGKRSTAKKGKYEVCGYIQGSRKFYSIKQLEGECFNGGTYELCAVNRCMKLKGCYGRFELLYWKTTCRNQC